MNLGKGFKPDRGTEAPEVDKLKKWMREAFEKFNLEQQDWMEVELRKLMPNWIVDFIKKHNTMTPTRFFGVTCECIEFRSHGCEALVVIRLGKLVAAKLFFPPSVGVL